jgi:hypothetical protein
VAEVVVLEFGKQPKVVEEEQADLLLANLY